MSAKLQLATRLPHVLIVDDDHRSRQLLTTMLTSEGFVLQTAEGGEQAVAMVDREPPDLILLDVMMPGMNGYQVAAIIKESAATQNIPVIIITALDDRDAKVRGLQAGAEDFLTKPVDRSELCMRVRNLLRLKAYGDYYDDYSQRLEGAVASRTADLAERTQQAAVLADQAALLDLAQDAIVVRDDGGSILLWNRGAELLYGWSSEEAIGRNAHDMLRAEYAGAIGDIDAALLRDGRWEGEVVHYTRAGTRVVVASRWALQRDLDGTPCRILTINNDITARKQADAELLQLRIDQLRFKDEFLSHVSHELRSPLTAIKQFTTILLGGLAGDLTPQQREYQLIVLKNIRQLQAMIDDLLEVTRLETGKLTVEPASVSVSDAVADSCETLQGTASAKGITLTRDVPPDLPWAHADQTRLRQILIILLENAIKFTPAAGAVSVQVRHVRGDRQFLVVEVSDTGCGIPAENRDRVFERLYQAAAHVQGSRKGLGLGLYICKELVTRQGGHIWVAPRQPTGTTFSFTLPVFSLDSSMAPLLKNDRWPADTLALVTAELCPLDGWPSAECQDEWSQDARALIERCLLPDLDVLLPTMSFGAEVRRLRFFVAAFADARGASILAARIGMQFARLPDLKTAGRSLRVSHQMLQPLLRDDAESTEQMVTRMATHLEESIKSQPLSETVCHD
jgi:PAS domain S-box-containing protein